MLFLGQRLHGTINSLTAFLSLLNCLDSMNACVTWVTGVRGCMSDAGQKAVWVQRVVWVDRSLD